MSQLNNAQQEQGKTANGINQSHEPIQYGHWTEYFDDDSGKPYYHHILTKECVWEEPEEFRVEKARAQVKKMYDTSKKTATLKNSIEKKTDSSLENNEKFQFLTKDEKIKTFKNFLKKFIFTPKIKWNEAIKLIQNEPEYKILTTNGEKKQIFAEFLTQLTNELNVSKRRKQKTARENFLKLLAANEKITASTRWIDIVQDKMGIQTDERWKDVEDDTERRDLFNTYLNDLTRNEKEYKRQKRQQNRRIFMELLGDSNKIGRIITTNTRFHEIRHVLIENTKELDIHGMDLEEWYHDYMEDLREKEEINKNEEKKKLIELQNELGYKFKLFLQKEIELKKLTTASRWKDCWSIYELNSIYCDLKKINSTMPRDIFETLMDRLHDDLREEKYILKEIILLSEFVMKYNSTYKSFVLYIEKDIQKLLLNEKISGFRYKFLTALLDVSTLPTSVIEWFDITHAKELERYKRVESERLKKVEAFEDMLMEYYFRSDHLHVTWEEARLEIQHRSAYRALDDEAEVAFQQYMQKLQKKMEILTKSRKINEERLYRDEKKKRKHSDTKKKSKKSSKKKLKKNLSCDTSNTSDSD